MHEIIFQITDRQKVGLDRIIRLGSTAQGVFGAILDGHADDAEAEGKRVAADLPEKARTRTPMTPEEKALAQRALDETPIIEPIIEP